MTYEEATQLWDKIEEQCFLLVQTGFKPCGLLLSPKSRCLFKETVVTMGYMEPLTTSHLDRTIQHIKTRSGDLLQIFITAEDNHQIEVVGRVKREGEL